MSQGPEYDSPGALPERDDFATKEDFLAVYPDADDLADIYFAEEDEPEEA